ncbi:MAG: AMP-binding protein [Planctomycetes bacterium]|nr:AMP-binding protein [Planctomycetota bacterium]
MQTPLLERRFRSRVDHLEVRRLPPLARFVQACVRVLLAPFARCVWRLRAFGREHVPAGGAIVVCNHVSYVDALLVASALGRPVVFLMQRELFRLPLVGWVARACGALPVAKGDAPRTTAATLELAASFARGGELVAIFAEGRLTPDGELQRFQRGVERLARVASAPIVPAHLSGLWGSWFSRKGGRAFAKWPGVPEAVDASFAPPLPHDAPVWRVESAVAALAADAATRRALRGPNLAKVLLRSARSHGAREALRDGERGLTYRRTALAALWLAREFDRAAPGERTLALFVPTSVGGALANLAATLAGRTTLNLNATLSDADLAEQCERAGARTLVTSRRFLAALERGSPLSPERGRTLFLEDLFARKSLGSRLFACAAFLVPWLARGVRVRANAPATVLFSSGSTARPKGVVLSHANVVSNVEAVSLAMALSPEDRMLDALPLFHSFGYTVALWAPLCGGATVLLHPNPLDASGFVALAERERATILLGTPTFYQGWMRRAGPTTFAHVRVAISGAQRLPRKLADAWRERFGVELGEGYGATELAPVVAVARPGERTLGSVGRPISGSALRVTDADGVEVAPGVQGLLHVRGPNVFAGYLDDPQHQREVLHDGWYVTGDVARVESDGSLAIVDRTARFSKIGGEMVSHGRVEEALLGALGELACELELAVTAVDDGERGERLVVLHTPLALAIEPLLARVRELGLPRLFVPRADAFLAVAALPKLASGKLDLAGLKRLAAARCG